MKKTIYLTLSILLWACGGSSEDDSPIFDNFTVNVTAQKNTLTIDEVVTVAVTANKNISNLQVSTDNFATSQGAGTSSGLGTATTLYFNFDTVGAKTISIKATNEAGTVVEKSVQINVQRGTALKINSLKILSFHNINQTWDPEFSGTDSNRLADVFFSLSKRNVHLTNGNLGSKLWLKSAVKQNQGDLTWNLTASNLYIDPTLSLWFSLADDDGTFSQDLLMGPPFERELKLSNYVTSKPSTLRFTIPEINLDLELMVEWP
ncbi:MAG: hypothetical protein NDI80_01740 [Flavobacteriaceae bacterium]|nr:hypothetical protein [Flavobacteriaceae bacterium]